MFLIVTGVNAAMLGFEPIFGHYSTLMAPSKEENEGMHREYRDARKKSWVHALSFSFDYAARDEGKLASDSVTH